MKKKKGTKKFAARQLGKTTSVVLSVGDTTTTGTNIRPSDIIWYPAAKASFVETTIHYLKRWFK